MGKWPFTFVEFLVKCNQMKIKKAPKRDMSG